jgi:hypothetical protein
MASGIRSSPGSVRERSSVGELLVARIVERLERRSVGESLWFLMDAMQLCGRSGDHFPRRIVVQDERAPFDERFHEGLVRVGGRHVAGEPV